MLVYDSPPVKPRFTRDFNGTCMARGGVLTYMKPVATEVNLHMIRSSLKTGKKHGGFLFFVLFCEFRSFQRQVIHQPLLT
jgi:hypothetical protein